jgi:leader peptidase (prepilin peptidase)/N-methyltransferase
MRTHFLFCALWSIALAAKMMTSPGVLPHTLSLIIVGCLVITAAEVDWQTFRLPHILTVPAAVVAVIGIGFWGDGWEAALQGAFLGFAILKGTQLFMRWTTKRECLGSGDAILMLSLGALVGVDGLPWCIVLAALSMAAKCWKKQERVPFGPFLTLWSLTFILIR